MVKVISVHSYRGGTGKSSVTSNLAALLAQDGYRVAVVDLDLPSPGIYAIFGVEPEGIKYSLNTFLWKESSIDQAVIDVSDRLGISAGKLYLLPSSPKADDIGRVLKSGYDAKLLNSGFKQIVKNFSLDYLFFDTHPGLSKDTFLSVKISHHLFLILLPDKQHYQGTSVTTDIARQLNVKDMKLIVNKVVTSIEPSVLKEKIQEAFGVDVAAVLPLSEDMVKLASEKVFAIENPHHEITQKYKEIVAQLK